MKLFTHNLAKGPVSIGARRLLAQCELADLVLIGYWLATFGIQLLFALPIHRQTGLLSRLLLLDLAMIGLLLLTAWGTAGLPEARRLLARIPVLLITILSAFSAIGYYITAVNHHNQEAWLIRLDMLVLGRTPSDALAAIASAPLSDFLHVCYSSYYFLPVLLCLGLLAAGKSREANHLVVTVVAAFVTSYLVYLLVPARSPYVVAADPATAHLLRFSHPLPGGAVAHTLHAWTDQAELNKYDCFPSGHTEVSLVVLVACWRYWRKAFPFFLAAVSGLLVGTLYLRYHYGIDIVAGALLAWWIVSAFPQWNQAWIEHRDRLPGGRRSADA